jgi:hypothetical protein
MTGFSWYPLNLFGQHANTSAIKLNTDNTVTLEGDTTGPNGELVTAAPSKNAAKFVGTAFGGGFYVEAVFKFNPADVAKANGRGWPSFWSLALEGSLLTGGDQWPGQASGYVHNVEVDFFEYLLVNKNTPKISYNLYGGGMHDWYGVSKKTCSGGLCQAVMPSNMGLKIAPMGTDFTKYHRYGFLWVPALATTQGYGYARFYFDGVQVGSDWHWSPYTNQKPSPVGQPWAFGKLDQQHLILILGTGPGEPLTVQSVNVWQKSAAQNLHN